MPRPFPHTQLRTRLAPRHLPAHRARPCQALPAPQPSSRAPLLLLALLVLHLGNTALAGLPRLSPVLPAITPRALPHRAHRALLAFRAPPAPRHCASLTRTPSSVTPAATRARLGIRLLQAPRVALRAHLVLLLTLAARAHRALLDRRQRLQTPTLARNALSDPTPPKVLLVQPRSALLAPQVHPTPPPGFTAPLAPLPMTKRQTLVLCPTSAPLAPRALVGLLLLCSVSQARSRYSVLPPALLAPTMALGLQADGAQLAP